MKICHKIFSKIILGLTGTFWASVGLTGNYSISGISSGGFMAAQMGLIYSSQFDSVGVVAGGFYGCAGNHFQDMMDLSKKNMQGLSVFFSSEINIFSIWKGDLKNSLQLSPLNPLYQAVSICMKAPHLAIADFERIRDFEQRGLIDPLDNLKDQRYLIYHGQNDSVVKSEMQNIHQKFLQELGVPSENHRLIHSEGGHNFPTDKKNLSNCKAQTVPYLASCEIDLAGEILQDAMKRTDLKKTRSEELIKKSPLFKISQVLKPKDEQGLKDSHPPSIAPYGYLAASPLCLANPEQCHLHVALHGCEMSDSFDESFDQSYAKGAQRRYLQMRDKSTFDLAPWLGLPYIEQRVPQMGTQKFAELAGYIEYANDENKLMILFPQTWIGIDNYPANPKGCWDWYGWTDRQYLTNKGQETSWLMKLTEAVAKNPSQFILQPVAPVQSGAKPAFVD